MFTRDRESQTKQSQRVGTRRPAIAFAEARLPCAAGNVKDQNIMLWWLLVLMAIVLLCSCLNARSELRESAIRALDASVLMAGRFELPVEDDFVPNQKEARTPPPRAEVRRNNSASPSKHGPGATWKTALYRKRPTPLMQKRVAVRYAFKCGICKLPLDETWETDHIVPLTKAKSFEDAERLNAIDNLQPVHRACHQIKTSREAR